MDFTADESGELVARLKGGDQQALAELYSRNRPRLWRMVHFRLDPRLRGRVDADDILQEGYLAAVERVQHFQDDSSTSFFVWLRLILGQTLIDVHRRHLGTQMRDAGREISIHGHRSPQATSVSLAAQLLGQFTSPSGAAVRDEVSRQLEQAVDAMNPIDREVLVLRHFEELTNGEVAEVLEIQPKAASIRYVRAVGRLREILSQLPGFSEEEDSDG
jgi:RNA polymerase sigma-70 factor, ECF subfamily